MSTKKYHLEFVIEGLPKITSNGSQGSWRAKYGNSKKWKQAVLHALASKKLPSEPLKKAKITLTRISSTQPDFDNLAISFKPVIDGLVEGNILVDDKVNNVNVTYRWKKGSPGDGSIKVEVCA